MPNSGSSRGLVYLFILYWPLPWSDSMGVGLRFFGATVRSGQSRHYEELAVLY